MDLSGIDVVRRHSTAGNHSALVELLRTSDAPITRVEAATALGSFTEDTVIDALTTALRTDVETDVRVEAARALGKIGRGSATRDSLVAGLSDRNANVVMWSAHALGQLRCTDAIEPLEALSTSADPWQRVYAVQALGRIRHRNAVPALLRAVGDERRMVFVEALDSLEPVADDRDIAALEGLQRQVPLLRRRRIGKLRRRLLRA